MRTPPQATKAFARGYHRVAVVDPSHTHKVVGIVTASDVLQVVCDNTGVLGQLASLPVGALFKTGAGAVACSPHTHTARQCFSALVHDHHLGMPVCDAAGAVVANVSASDIRRLVTLSSEAAAGALDRTILEYLELVRAASTSGGSSGSAS